MRPEGPRQRRLIPFKVLTVLLYGQFDCIKWTSSESVTLKLGPLSRLLGIPNYRLRDYLRWLESNFYLSDLTFTYGVANCKVAPPIFLSVRSSSRNEAGHV
jgi:hypothetical protein